MADSVSMTSTISRRDKDIEDGALSYILVSKCHLVTTSIIPPHLALDDLETRIVVVGKETAENSYLKKSLEKFGFPVFYSVNGLEFIADADKYDTIFVLDNFEDDVFNKLHKAEARILGPPVIIKCARDKETLPFSSRPLYCTAMHGLIICFSGFKKRDELAHLAGLVHHMAGSIRKDCTTKVTHLVANSIGGVKYKYAVSFHTPIMSEDWLHRVWSQKDEIDLRADAECMMAYRAKPFFHCCLSFYGYSDEEQKHMEEITLENGGLIAPVGHEDCTHLVVEESVKDLPVEINAPFYVVRGAWFWGCMQMQACANENLHIFQRPETPAKYTSGSGISGSKSRKRKRLKENIALLASEGEFDSPIYSSKRRSSDLGGLSMSPNSFLDASGTPDQSQILPGDVTREGDSLKPAASTVKTSPRLQVAMELLQTERNYVGILNTVLNIFKAEIEKPDQYNGPLLAPQDIKIIFGNIPPIYDVHCRIRDALADVVANWNEDQSIGDIYLPHSEQMVKIYPPFVNFFEKTKETITKCDKSNPRFHAFLKVCHTKPECGRQTLTELLIRPVQRLPSVILLLTDLLKHTSKSNPDSLKLENTISAVKEVLTHINEDKRKTESQVVMFDIVNDIDNCPPNLLSSHRNFITRIDVVELSDGLSGRGGSLTLFLFSDSLEICKRRLKVINSYKSPASHHKTPQKAYKHLDMLSLSCIKRVLNLIEEECCKNSFALIYRSKDECKDRLYSFMVDSDDRKSDFLTTLCKCTANTMCRADYETIMASVHGDEIQTDTSDISTKSKAVRYAKRVSRAFSFNKTPGKLKRAVSSVFSPFVRENAHTKTPNSEMKGRRLASTMDLTESGSPLGSIHENPGADFDSDANSYADTMSIGAYSLQEDMSPVTSKRPSSLKKLTKYMTLGPNSTRKFF